VNVRHLVTRHLQPRPLDQSLREDSERRRAEEGKRIAEEQQRVEQERCDYEGVLSRMVR
jgi:hypothetical protein